MLWLAGLPDTTGLYFMLNQPEGTAIEVDFVIPVFNGTLNGNGRTINLDIIATDAGYLGLFGRIESGGIVRNLRINGTVSSELHSNPNVGGLTCPRLHASMPKTIN